MGFNAEQKAGREAIHEYEQRHPAPPQPLLNPIHDERMFRTIVIAELLALRGDNRHLHKQMESLMSATTDLQAAAAAMDVRMDSLGDIVASNTAAILAAITAIVAGSNPDGSVSADVANAVVEEMKIHLASVEANVAALGPAVTSLDAAVHPAPPVPAPPAPPA